MLGHYVIFLKTKSWQPLAPLRTPPLRAAHRRPRALLRPTQCNHVAQPTDPFHFPSSLSERPFQAWGAAQFLRGRHTQLSFCDCNSLINTQLQRGVVVASGGETVSTVSIIVALKHITLHKQLEFLQKARLQMVFFLGRKSVFKWGDDEAGVHEYLENCRRPPMHHGEGTLAEPGIRIWTPSNDLAQSRRRASSATEVLGCQWDALKPL